MSATQRRLVTPLVQSLLVGVKDAAGELGMGRGAVYQLEREGRLRSVRVGRKILIPRSELVAFIERETNRAQNEGPELVDDQRPTATGATGSRNASYPD